MGNTNCRLTMTDEIIKNNGFYRMKNLVILFISLLIWYYFYTLNIEIRFVPKMYFDYIVLPILIFTTVNYYTSKLLYVLIELNLDQKILKKLIDNCKKWQTENQSNCQYGDINEKCIINPDDIITYI